MQWRLIYHPLSSDCACAFNSPHMLLLWHTPIIFFVYKQKFTFFITIGQYLFCQFCVWNTFFIKMPNFYYSFPVFPILVSKKVDRFSSSDRMQSTCNSFTDEMNVTKNFNRQLWWPQFKNMHVVVLIIIYNECFCLVFISSLQ